MSRQYLKELQQRAQRLLEVSSEEQEDINAYTATDRNTRSPARIDLDNFLFEDRSDNDTSELDPPRTTDVELLKKCISLTNENNSLRSQLERKDLQIKELQIKLLMYHETESQASKKDENKKEHKQRLQNNHSTEAELKLLSLQLSQLQKEISDIKMQRNALKNQYSEFMMQKQKFRKQKEEYNKSICQKSRQMSPEIDIQNDYTIKTVKAEHFKMSQQLSNEYQARIRRLQAILREQRSKVNKLCQFINAEIPALKDKVVQMTTKLDVKVSRYLLRDCAY